MVRNQSCKQCPAHLMLSFTSDCSKHCIIFISASHTLNQKRREGRCPLLAAEIPVVPFYLFSFSSFCEISEADATLTTEDFRTQGLAGDGWRSIYITLPGASPLLPSLSPLFLLVNLGKAAERVQPQRGIMGISERGHDRRGREAVEPVIARRAVRSLQRSHSKGSVVTCNM